ncbi:MAG: U32 family peptidase, partial [Planctomycetota bacterium]|nr:U32 family peptidase [Planctomycetota bacterium]
MSPPRPAGTPELLAPAGGPEAGHAALAYGADAVYLGLANYSARAGAINFTPGQLIEFTAWAHSLAPRRRVYLALNTLIKQNELADAAKAAAMAADAGVDAIIVQDLGMLRLIRERFPDLPIHASTQMAIHNLAGAREVAALGCGRVTLARELTLAEVATIAAGVGIEVEVFIHGTLCYSYSGLCFFSSLAGGRSGNRGRCAYPCREAAITPAGRLHPFSLKDLAIGERAPDLARAGVASLKIEGRKKSPLYVAATVDYYRKILDGKMPPDARQAAEAGLKTIFARPWTKFFLDGKRNPDAADPETVGHRGSRIGQIKGLIRTPAGPGIRFRPSMRLERHDGCQIDLPGQSRPLGFAIDHLYLIRNRRLEPVFAVPAGEEAALAAPADAPKLRPGLPLYLSSSQAVKRAWPFASPKPGKFGLGRPIDVEISLSAGEAAGGTARVVCRGGIGETTFTLETDVPAFPARDGEWAAAAAARQAFSRLGGKRFALASLRFNNPRALFLRPGDWNRLRRDWLAGLERELAKKATAIADDLANCATAREAAPGQSGGEFRWSIFVDDPTSLDGFAAADFAACAEVIVGLEGAEKPEALNRLASRAGRDKIRLALPVIQRGDLESLIAPWVKNAWRRWLLPGLAGRERLAALAGADLAVDWTLPILNRLAAGQLAGLGFSRLTLSPEDDGENWLELLREFPDKFWAPVYSEIPLFISAACAQAHIGLCQGGSVRCPHRGTGLELKMEKSGGIRLWPQSCGSVVTGERPFSLAGRLGWLRGAGCRRPRLDLRWRPYASDEALGIWRRARAGTLPPG